jgi:hypothetical protein
LLRFLTVTMALVLGASLARAGALPTYDIETACEDLAGTSAKQELVMRGCLDFEERTRKEIALAWDTLSDDVQNSCDKLAKQDGIPSYYRLKACIDKKANDVQDNAPGR